LLGADKTKQQEILKQATAQANDVSQVVRKKAKPAPKPVGADEGKGKRKLEVEGEGSGKRSKTEEPSS
jgi:HAT1-interacting factor 1